MFRMGTSPRTRGKHGDGFPNQAERRNIPAHAGKTPGTRRPGPGRGEHPRARGENINRSMSYSCYLGTSPRTRGKLRLIHDEPIGRGNIPAHAGKTRLGGQFGARQKEHPRARGENFWWVGFRRSDPGTSPRTRGKPGSRTGTGLPAAEHPRARGENEFACERLDAVPGTSPRTRGKLTLGILKDDQERNIPAHAGKT